MPLHSAVLDTCRTGSASATAWAPYFLLAVLRRRGRRRCDGSFQVAGWPRILAARWAKDLPNPIRRSAVASLSAEFQLRLSLWPVPAYARWLRFAEQWLATFIQCPLPPSFCKARFSARQHPLPPHGLPPGSSPRQLPCRPRPALIPQHLARTRHAPEVDALISADLRGSQLQSRPTATVSSMCGPVLMEAAVMPASIGFELILATLRCHGANPVHTAKPLDRSKGERERRGRERTARQEQEREREREARERERSARQEQGFTADLALP